MEHIIDRNLTDINKNKLLYHCDYQLLFKNLNEEYEIIQNVDLINNINNLFLLNNILLNKDIILTLNNIFTNETKIIINETDIDIIDFCKILIIINKSRKFYVNLFNLNNYEINNNTFFSNDFKIVLKNKKINYVSFKHNNLFKIVNNLLNQGMYKKLDLKLNFDFSNKYLLNINDDKIDEYNKNLFVEFIKIYYMDILVVFKNQHFKIPSIKNEYNILTSLFFMNYKFNADYLNYFSNLFSLNTIFSLNNKIVDYNYYLNLYIKLLQSFTNINYKINKISVNKNTITILYNFSGNYTKYRYYLENNSKNIISNNQKILIENEQLIITFDELSKKIIDFKIINENNEHAGLELVYHKLLNISSDELIDDNNTIEEYYNNLNKQNNLDISNNTS